MKKNVKKMDCWLDVKGVSKTYDRIVALNDVSFSANKGEIIALLGPNGAGKSTLMNIISGYLAPSNGSVCIKGVDVAVNDIATKKEIGFLSEGSPLYSDMSVKRFLQNGYGELDYQVEDTDLIASYLVEKDAEWQPIKSPIMEPSNIIFSLILKEVDTPGLLCFAVFEDALNYPMFMTAGIFGEAYYDASEKRQKILARRLLRQDVENLPKYEKTHNVDGFVRDSDHKLVCFGHEYKVDLSLVAKEPDQYQPLIEVLKTRDDDVWQAFQRVKKYYDALTRRHRDA